MSNISRRDFLKTAGVMTLAVAAAGVLAGCEGNKPNEETPIVTGNSVTVGDYTLTLKETKLFSVKHYNSDETKPNEVTSEDRYVVVLGNLKNNNDSAEAPSFGLDVKAVNLSGHDGKIKAAGVKKLFNLNVDATEWVKDTGFGGDAVFNKTAEGTPYFWAYKVDAYKDETFKTPAITVVANDTKGQVYTKIEVAIPASATVVTEKQLKGQE